MVGDLGEPDADNNRFPVRLQHSGKSWSKYWNYTDINIAKDFYRTRTYLKAEGLFQIEEAATLSPKLTAARVTHPGTKETRRIRFGDAENIHGDCAVREIPARGGNGQGCQ